MRGRLSRRIDEFIGREFISWGCQRARRDAFGNSVVARQKQRLALDRPNQAPKMTRRAGFYSSMNNFQTCRFLYKRCLFLANELFSQNRSTPWQSWELVAYGKKSRSEYLLRAAF